MKFAKKIVTIIVSIMLFIFGTVILLYASFLEPVSKDSNEKVIEIKAGS